VVNAAKSALWITGVPKWFWMTSDYLLGYKPSRQDLSFHQSLAGWMLNFWSITAVNVVGLFIRCGFFLSLFVAVGFEIWTGYKNLISGRGFPVFLLRVVVVALLG
jgi:hypothetical protein